MIDIVREIEAVQREVGEGTVPAGVGRSVTLQRDYAAPIEDVWDALTNPERIGRWFLPISGDYRLGGRYQFEGNAGGKIVACEQPNRLKVTWVYGPATERRRLGASRSGCRPSATAMTRFELEHTAVVPDEMWAEYGPGAVGVGWEQGPAGALAPSPGWVASDDPDRLAAVAGGTRLLAPEQRGLGRGEPGRRRRSRGGRPRCGEHDGVLRAGAGGRVVSRTLQPTITARRRTSQAGWQVHVADSAQGSDRSRSRRGRSEGDREPTAAATARGRTGRCDTG